MTLTAWMDLNTSALRIITQYPGAYFLSNSYVKQQKSIFACIHFELSGQEIASSIVAGSL